MKLLRIDASSRTESSESRKMADKLMHQLKNSYPDTTITIRDIIGSPLPHITQTTIEGFYTPEDKLTETLLEATQLSDTLIDELNECDTLLISTPMYNFGVPSALKAWIDQIVRINRTFGVADDNSFYGMVKHLKAYVITSAGAVYSNESMEDFDFLTGYLQTVLGLIGITDVTFLPLEGTTLDPDTFSTSLKKAEATISKL